MKIIGAMLVYNEDVYLERVLENVKGFVDHMLVADTGSTDGTMDILRKWEGDNFEVVQCGFNDTHQIVETYAGGDYWMFGVNGEEIYDPAGLQVLKAKLHNGDYDNNWRVYGMHFHVTEYNPETHEAVGYLAPPSHAPQKLYNFMHLASWNDDHERTLFLSGDCIFKPEWEKNVKANNSPNSDRLNQDCGWEMSFIRCAHMHFVRRSSMDPENIVGLRLSAEDKIGRGSWNDRGKRNDVNMRLKYKKGGLHRINIKEFFV